MMSNLRVDFLILKFRKTLTKIIRAYVQCKRYDFKPFEITTLHLSENREAAILKDYWDGLSWSSYSARKSESLVAINTCAVFQVIHFE